MKVACLPQRENKRFQAVTEKKFERVKARERAHRNTEVLDSLYC